MTEAERDRFQPRPFGAGWTVWDDQWDDQKKRHLLHGHWSEAAASLIAASLNQRPYHAEQWTWVVVEAASMEVAES